jgi:hypothetical protein
MIHDIDSIKEEFPDNFDEWIEGYITEQEMWDDELIYYIKKDEYITTYKEAWKNKDKRKYVAYDIDDMLEQFLDYVIEQLNKDGLLLWNNCPSDREDCLYEMWKDDVELHTEEELVMLIAGLINKGVKIDIDNIMTKVLIHVI